MLSSSQCHLASHFPSCRAFGIMAMLLFAIGLSTSVAARTASLEITVDATELPRKLLHSRISYSAVGDSLSVLFPKWIPGIHGPRGPIQNIGGFEVFDSRGEEIPWERDWSEVYRFILYPARRSTDIEIRLTYIASQPSTNSIGIDSYGTPDLGIINWNTVIIYPEGIPVKDIETDVRLILPHGWRHGSALPVKSIRGDTVHFETVSLETLVDMPLVCGINFRTIEFAKTDMATYYLHVVADDQGDLPHHDDSTLLPMKRLADEAEALFGRTHFDEYHFLLTLSDNITRTGLEHRNSSLNGVKADEWRKADWPKSRTPYLLPHEFAHAWCGKYRRPAGMHTPDFQTNKDTDLLWVYEGLDQYLGRVLAARCGFSGTDEFVEYVARNVASHKRQKGRKWRSVRDTEVSAYTLRGGSASWGNLRRSQDYYRDGALLWLEFDAMIRNATDGKKSLDDFCAVFFSNGDTRTHSIPFDKKEIVATLNSIASGPYDSLINVRIHESHEKFDPQMLIQAGYRLEYTDKLPDVIKNREEMYKYFDAYESLGLSLNKSGKILDVVPKSPTDKAGLIPGSTIVGVSGKKYSHKRMKDAIKNSVMTEKIKLLILRGDEYQNMSIDYSDGLRYYKLTPVDGQRDWLTEIAKPRTYTPETKD